MAKTLREHMARHDDASQPPVRPLPHRGGSLAQCKAEDKILTVRLHPLAKESADAAIRHLCAEINATETLFPGTELRLIYELVSSRNR